MKRHKICLIGSIIALVISFLDIGTAPQWFLAGPVGALLFGMFLVFRMLDSEAARFDEEEQRRDAPIRDNRRPEVSKSSQSFAH